MMELEHARRLNALHAQDTPLSIYNAWDAGSAAAIRDAGAPAIGTSSWAIAAAQGFDDGEELPLDVLLQIAARIVAKVDVPVTVDFEGGYAEDAAGCARNVARLLDIGVVGINFEDRVVKAPMGLYATDVQCARIEAIRGMAEARGIPLFINARTDVYFESGIATEHRLEEAKARAAAYLRAGASGFFAPGLTDIAEIAALCASTPLPVNVMKRPGSPDVDALVKAGVKRISYGPGPYIEAMAGVREAAAKVIARA
jgi:2-methylisocitrate lyase-like PEP mutase family enzyme